MMGVARRVWAWIDDRTGVNRILAVAMLHKVPPGVAGRSGWFYVFGTAVLATFLIQVVTGAALATAYIPSTAHAFDSLQFITHDATFGRVLRGIHYFGASAMIILLGIHVARVFLTGSYKFPREVNWLTGVVLFGLVFVMAFTGQLLRWDQDAVGSVLVLAEQAGRLPLIGGALAHFILAGREIGGATLTRFYAIHVFIVPVLIFGVIGAHLWLVIHNGISEPPAAGRKVEPAEYRPWYHALVEREGRSYFPYAIWREAVFVLFVVGVIVLLAVVVGPKHIGLPPDPTNTTSNPRPDWYLIWVFALLAIVPYGYEDFLIVLAPVLLALIGVVIPFAGNRGERAPSRRPWVVGIVITVFAAIGVLWYTGQTAPWSPHFQTQPFSAQALGVSSGPAYDGSQVFFEKGCQFCHSVNGRGGSRGHDLTDVTTRLTNEDIRARVLAPLPGMPSYNGNITPQQLDQIVAFLDYVGGRATPQSQASQQK